MGKYQLGNMITQLPNFHEDNHVCLKMIMITFIILVTRHSKVVSAISLAERFVPRTCVFHFIKYLNFLAYSVCIIIDNIAQQRRDFFLVVVISDLLTVLYF